jgi:hypothetical protein
MERKPPFISSRCQLKVINSGILNRKEAMLATHLEAEQRYGILRNNALRASEQELRLEYPELRLTTIDSAALQASRAWSELPGRRVNWDWRASMPAFRFRYPKRFEVAVWYRRQLNCLSIGRPTYAGTALRLDFIEGSPAKREIAVFEVVLVAMFTYAKLLGADEIRVMHPLNDVVRNYYVLHDFSYVSQGDYLFRRLSP